MDFIDKLASVWRAVYAPRAYSSLEFRKFWGGMNNRELVRSNMLEF